MGTEMGTQSSTRAVQNLEFGYIFAKVSFDPQSSHLRTKMSYSQAFTSPSHNGTNQLTFSA